MRKIFCIILIIIILLGGIFLTAYPYLYNAYTEKHQSQVTDKYAETVEKFSPEEIGSIKSVVAEYNKSLLTESAVLTDPFDPDTLKSHDSDSYAEFLNVDGDGTIAVLQIPKIKLKLPVYHGTSEEVLTKGLGQLENTSLPIGGESTHSVITGHTGLPDTKLFTDLTEIVEGDVFYINVIGETLAYEVDHIEIVKPEYTKLLQIEKGKDYVSLLTCYPYGINSHRLVVRGVRVPYEEAKVQEKTMEDTNQGSSQWNREYFKTISICVAGYGVLFIAFIVIRAKRANNKNKQR